jgi:hypothetical protein
VIGHGPPFYSDGASIGLVHAEQDVHQRSFAGTVFAQQTQHLATEQLQVYGFVCVHATEVLVDAAHLE